MPNRFNKATKEARSENEANPETVLDSDGFAVEGKVVDAADENYLKGGPCHHTKSYSWCESGLKSISI